MTLREFTKLKEDIEALQSQLDRTLGARDKLKSDLFEKFECASIKEARTRLVEMGEEIEEEDRKFQKRLEAFQNEHIAKLSERV